MHIIYKYVVSVHQAPIGRGNVTLRTSSQNSSKPPLSDSPKERHEWKKIKALVVTIREELKKATQGIDENSNH